MLGLHTAFCSCDLHLLGPSHLECAKGVPTLSTDSSRWRSHLLRYCPGSKETCMAAWRSHGGSFIPTGMRLFQENALFQPKSCLHVSLFFNKGRQGGGKGVSMPGCCHIHMGNRPLPCPCVRLGRLGRRRRCRKRLLSRRWGEVTFSICCCWFCRQGRTN